ncbi:ABC transporter substrate-binding protein [Actinomadura bangladeshensis]|uniref:Sugar ABC transporter substrate-binding protein n=1 Tax=Actinomadura bangladeshensis TaxID=453573 RepID=A0A6L9QDB3_9ACTN|nr:sugar ABC transporter substrate-binding protein [Actinomadura bangladeshensis]NEA23471.1 sugar ABC transporter substrate-binding protein [Actinomadura bangladeshensis]
MRHTTFAGRAAAVLTAGLLAAATAACGGGTASGGGNGDPKTLTYWASNQGTDIAADQKVLNPELAKFEKQTGIKVELEVVPWTDLLNRILAATTSGQGPDVLNIGNTWSASLQATGGLLPFDGAAMAEVGGADRFVPAALASAGAKGKPPAAVPLYSLAYGLYYNKTMFADANLEPPKTWQEMVDAGRRLTKDGKYGIAVEGASIPENVHAAFNIGQMYGADFFTADGRPQFATPQAVKAIKSYVDLIAREKIAAPGNAEYSANQSLNDFATGKAAMLMWQATTSGLTNLGMKPGDWGVVPLPKPSPAPPGGRDVTSMVAGINIAVFKNTDNRDGALDFVKFMTSDDEQKILNKAYGSLPAVTSAQNDPAFDTPDLRVFKDILATSAAPLPQVPEESQFETAVGTAMKDLFADAAAGKPVTEERVRQVLAAAQEQMGK